MKYLVIGLGTYGRELAINLSLQGNEVIGVDHRSENIEAVKEQLMTVYELDAKDENSLKLLPLKNMDIVIVAIGEDFGASLKTVALLKKNGVKHIYARAIDNLHQSIHHGLASIQEQVSFLNGKMTIKENPEGGTNVSIFIPMKGDESYASFIGR